jgi:threonine dehydratase
MADLITLEDITKAQATIKNLIKRTPVVECPTLETLTGNKIYFKLENLQKTGSFKVRGAMNKIANLTEDEKNSGVIASSAGNHAQGVALGASLQGIKATIVMPETAPLAKISATQGYGADVVLAGSVYDDAYNKACEIQKETGATFLHPFDDEYVIAGQGTIGLEILEDLPDIDVVIAPIGGGGILAGIAMAVKSIKPEVMVIGVQTKNVPSMREAIKKDQICEVNAIPTIADGIAVKKAGSKTFELIRKYVDEIVTVSEDDIAKSILFLLEKSKVSAEGAGATPVAAILADRINLIGKKICAVISGGNIDINLLERVLNRALILEGRRAEFNVRIPDKVGEMEKLIKLISTHKANILQLSQTMMKECLGINTQEVNFVLECLDKNHRDEIKKVLTNAGYEVH